jgi:hypothetical protein
VHQEAGELVAAALLPLLGRIADLANVPDVPADDGRDTARIRPAS